jgi:anti-anti-sigma regulatory factor
MLRITFQEDPEGTTLKLEGKISGPWVNELERSWTEHPSEGSKQVTVDLSDVTYIDPEGKRLLARMMGEGVYLQGTQLMARYIIDEITRAGAHAGRNGG